MNASVQVAAFDFELPEGAIATAPAEPRDHSRLLVYDRGSRTTEHRRFFELGEFLRSGDLLVLNDTRVRPWRLRGVRPTGGGCECLLLSLRGAVGEGFVKPSKKLRPGDVLAIEPGALRVRLVEKLDGGRWRLELEADDEDLEAAIDRCGRAPLPPYITRDRSEDVALDRERYQTVFARKPGAVAAPTAGLHFTEGLLGRLEARGIRTATVTLHVGEGTFAPVRVEEVERHRMHAEAFELSEVTARAIAETRSRGGRVVAVGTTSCRTLETCARDDRTVEPGSGRSSLFLYPGRPFRVVDALLTNFHLPRSTLLMLVAAFAGTEEVLGLYREAVRRGYRFYSFGDAMLVT